MADIVDQKTRSRMMSCIRGVNTVPELVIRKFLHAQGFRFRLHQKKLPGKPDLVLSRYQVAIQVNGCFWHRHEGCSNCSTPGSNTERWKKKFDANVERDRWNVERLRSAGWRVLVIWECGVRRTGMKQDLTWLPDWIRNGTETYMEWPMPGASR